MEDRLKSEFDERFATPLLVPSSKAWRGIIKVVVVVVPRSVMTRQRQAIAFCMRVLDMILYR